MMQTLDNEYASTSPDQAAFIAAQINAANLKSKKIEDLKRASVRCNRSR